MGSAETPDMPTEESVRAVLRKVIDPEVGMDVVELGLIYGIAIGPSNIDIVMTMTTPACPMSAMIMQDAQREIGAVAPPGTAIDVQLVWEPPWDSSMMSEHAKKYFGW